MLWLIGCVWIDEDRKSDIRDHDGDHVPVWEEL
jgi:hypothetical protein